MTPGPLALVGGDELHPGNEPIDRVLVETAGGGPAFVLATAGARQGAAQAVRNAQAWFAELGAQVEELPATKRAHVTDPANVALAETGRLFYLVGGDPGSCRRPGRLARLGRDRGGVGGRRRARRLVGGRDGARELDLDPRPHAR